MFFTPLLIHFQLNFNTNTERVNSLMIEWSPRAAVKFDAVKFSQNFGFNFDETFTGNFRQKDSNFYAKSFYKLSHEILTKVLLPQHY